MSGTLFTLEEARALLPRVKAMLPKLRDALERWRFAKEQVDDLEAMWGDRLRDPQNPDRADYGRLVGAAAVAEREAKTLLAGVTSLGVEVKDPILGLVDFPAARGDETVYLCFRDGEDDIVAWHPMTAGFAGRRPLAEF